MKFIAIILLVFGLGKFSIAQNSSGGELKCAYDSASVYTFVDKSPEFPEGEDSLRRFLAQHSKYPKVEHDNDVEGRVVLKLVITENGEVCDVIVWKGASYGFVQEAVRVAKLLPGFTPGYVKGKPVAVYYNLPITFKLN